MNPEIIRVFHLLRQACERIVEEDRAGEITVGAIEDCAQALAAAARLDADGFTANRD